MIEHMTRLVIHGANFDPIGAACRAAIDLRLDITVGRVMIITRLATHKQMMELMQGLDVRSADAKRKKPVLAVSTDIVLVHPEMVGKILEQAPKKFFGALIIVQGNDFKNPKAARFNALRRRLREMERRYVYSLGGNNLMDIWSQMFIVDFGESLGKYRTEFYNRYCEPFGFQGRQWRVRDTAVAEIMRAIEPSTTIINLDATKEQVDGHREAEVNS